MSTPFNGSLLKGIEILRLATREQPELTAARVQAELGMNAATAHRFLSTLEEAGMLSSLRRGVYRLSLAAAEMGQIAEETNPYIAYAKPVLESLCSELNESVMLCRLGRKGPTCVMVETAERPITVSIRVGTFLSLLRSAQGRLWLAFMSRSEAESAVRRMEGMSSDTEIATSLDDLEPELATIRSSGFARNRGAAEPDIGAVATAVGPGKGSPVLTLSVFGPLNRISDDFAAQVAPRLRVAADRIAGQMT